jgi:hypothetical protein
MVDRLKAGVMAAFVACATLAGAVVPAVAQNDGIYLNFGGRQDRRFGIYMGEGSHERDWRPKREWRRNNGDGGAPREWRRDGNRFQGGEGMNRDRRNWWRGGGGRSRFWQND